MRLVRYADDRIALGHAEFRHVEQEEPVQGPLARRRHDPAGQRRTDDARDGSNLFSGIGCAQCHTRDIVTAAPRNYNDAKEIGEPFRDGGVHLINASRGRVAQLQRWPDGVQAAVELKEGLTQTDSGEVIDTITCRP